ncbi:MAG TPA: nucleoside deaminase [Candidatus Omnitrophota bacterium]|nr:nucleoside deaminase [Candidatus Omnitrophota bacterium]
MKSKPQKPWMKRAVNSAQKGIRRLDGGPFGAAIIRQGKAIAVTHNTVLKNQDATCHAEMNAIRIACRKLKRFDLSDCVIYSTTEPCPMCFSAIHWARIPRLIFGTKIQDVQKRGFHELSIPSKKMKSHGKSSVVITAGFMRKECLQLLRLWDCQPMKQVY